MIDILEKITENLLLINGLFCKMSRDNFSGVIPPARLTISGKLVICGCGFFFFYLINTRVYSCDDAK